ncbi:MAG: hypothetical protein ACRC20_14025 [Segniliparus sp.]|uniref:hypothetical protein n=1 Tax=Segniliparus sp. TaxID=2804064 RepID=UPI003F2E0A1E
MTSSAELYSFVNYSYDGHIWHEHSSISGGPPRELYFVFENKEDGSEGRVTKYRMVYKFNSGEIDLNSPSGIKYLDPNIAGAEHVPQLFYGQHGSLHVAYCPDNFQTEIRVAEWDPASTRDTSGPYRIERDIRGSAYRFAWYAGTLYYFHVTEGRRMFFTEVGLEDGADDSYGVLENDREVPWVGSLDTKEVNFEVVESQELLVLVYADSLYSLRSMVFDGESWSEPTVIPGASSINRFGLLDHDGLLYLAYSSVFPPRPYSREGQQSVIKFDGVSWSAPELQEVFKMHNAGCTLTRSRTARGGMFLSQFSALNLADELPVISKLE